MWYIVSEYTSSGHYGMHAAVRNLRTCAINDDLIWCDLIVAHILLHNSVFRYNSGGIHLFLGVLMLSFWGVRPTMSDPLPQTQSKTSQSPSCKHFLRVTHPVNLVASSRSSSHYATPGLPLNSRERVLLATRRGWIGCLHQKIQPEVCSRLDSRLVMSWEDCLKNQIPTLLCISK